jgi:hypothetical protein
VILQPYRNWTEYPEISLKKETPMHTNTYGFQHLGNFDAENISDFQGQSDFTRTNTGRPENFGI